MKFLDYFKPEVGESKAEIVGKLEAMMDQLRDYAKKGYEHEASKCESGVEGAGGWVDPKMGVCSACGLYVGKLAPQISALNDLLQKFKELPDDYKYGGIK